MSNIFKDSIIKIGFIGAGNHAAMVLYPAIQSFEQAKIVSVCDLDKERAEFVGSRFGAEGIYTDYCEMVEKEELDAIFCCGGPKLHYEAICDLVGKGKPIFVEKPPAPRADEVKKIALLAEQYNTHIMVAFMHRYANITAWAKKAMGTTEFGKLMMLSAKEGIWGTEINNVVMDSGIHHIDLLRYLGGDIKWLLAANSTDGRKRHGFAVTVCFQNGAVGTLNINSLESLSTPSDVIEIYGENGQWIKLDNWDKATWYRDSGKLWSPPDDPRNSSLIYEHSWTGASTNRSAKLQGYIDEVAHFLSCVANGNAPKPDLWDGFKAMQIVEAIYESARSGEKVYFE